MILLDSNICIALLRRNKKAMERFRQSKYGEVAVPEIVRAELYYGAYLSNNTEENLKNIDALLLPLKTISMDRAVSIAYAQLRAELRQKGQMIGPNDLIIAAIAITGNHTLISNNKKEFVRVGNIKLDDWLV